MKCMVCGRGPMFTWGDQSDGKFDYYCSAHHGPLGDGIFYNEVWDGEKYVLTPTRPSQEEINEWPEPKAWPAPASGHKAPLLTETPSGTGSRTKSTSRGNTTGRSRGTRRRAARTSTSAR